MKLRHVLTLCCLEYLPGDWTMVVMDYLHPGQYHNFDANSQMNGQLYQSMKEALENLHRARFVYGDVCAVNTLVKSDNADKPSKFMLVDFNWAGIVNQVCYLPTQCE
jgi:tRNA A-37 threonylcarbamoyl transferase component Bud32